MTTRSLGATGASTSGLRKTIYEIRRDNSKATQPRFGKSNVKPFPFKTSGCYKGEWKDNQKHGYGVQMLEDGTRYEGEFGENRFHGRGTLWQSVKLPSSNRSKQTKVYAGEWQRGKMHGHGQQTDAEGNVYIGMFAHGKRSGTGKLEMVNGDVYEGEWEDDAYHGAGVFTYHTGNVFEGRFSRGKKQGPGKFYYASTDKVYEGEWLGDTPRCGYLRYPDDSERQRYADGASDAVDEAERAAQRFTLPECTLVDPAQVLSEALASCGAREAARDDDQTGTPTGDWLPRRSPPRGDESQPLESAQQLFESKLSAGRSDSMPLIELQDVFAALGVHFTFEDLTELAAQLEITMETSLSFVEVTEIAAYMIDANHADEDVPVSRLAVDSA